jgi:hypothetical protein
MPKCKNSDSDCDALRQYAREKQAAADSAARELPNAETKLKEADAADRNAAGYYESADRTYATAAGYAKLGQKDQEDYYTKQAREFQQKGDAEKARAKQLQADAAAIKEKAETTAKEAQAAWKAYSACLSLPPCPPETPSQVTGRIGENAPGANPPGGGGASSSGVFNPVERAMGTGSSGGTGGSSPAGNVFQLMITSVPLGEQAVPPPPVQRAEVTPGPAVPGQTTGGAGGTTPTGGGQGATTPAGGTGAGGGTPGATGAPGTGTGGTGAGTGGVKNVATTSTTAGNNCNCDDLCRKAEQAEKEAADAERAEKELGKDSDAKAEAARAVGRDFIAADDLLTYLKKSGVSPSPEQVADLERKKQASTDADKAAKDARDAVREPLGKAREATRRARNRAKAARLRCELCRRRQPAACPTVPGGALTDVSLPGGLDGPCRDCLSAYKEWQDADLKRLEAESKYYDAKEKVQELQDKQDKAEASFNKPGYEEGAFGEAVAAKRAAQAEVDALEEELKKAKAAESAAKAKYDACIQDPKHCPLGQQQRAAGSGGLGTTAPGKTGGAGASPRVTVRRLIDPSTGQTAPYTGPIDSLLQDEPFQINVIAPGSGPRLNITFLIGNDTRTLTLEESGPGTGSYLSQPITAKSGGFKAADGQQIVVTTDAGGGAIFRVYDTNVTQALWRYKQGFMRIQNNLLAEVARAEFLLRLPNLKPEVIPILKSVIQVDKFKLKLIDDANTTLARQRQMNTDLYKQIATSVKYADLVTQVNDENGLRALGSTPEWRGEEIGRLYQQEARDFLMKSFAYGVRAAGINAIINPAGIPLGSLATVLTGVSTESRVENWAGPPLLNPQLREATEEEIVAGLKDIIVFAVTTAVAPNPENIARELSGLGPKLPLGRPVTSGGLTSARRPGSGILPETGLTKDALAGVEKARQLGLPGVEELLARATEINPKTLLQALDTLGAEARLDSLGRVDRAEAAAYKEGLIPPERIRSIIETARKANTTEAWADVPRQLELAKFEQSGGVILTAEGNAELAQNLFGEGTKIRIVTVPNKQIGNLLSLKTRVELAVRDGKLPQLSPAEVKVLREEVVPQGNNILKWYSFNGMTLEVEPIFDKQFINDLRGALKRSANAGNPEAARLLAELDWNTLASQAPPPPAGNAGPTGTERYGPGETPPAPPSEPTGPPGTQVLKPGENPYAGIVEAYVAGLSNTELQEFTAPEFRALRKEVQRAIVQELQARGLTPRYGGAPPEGNLAMNPEVAAQRYARLVRRLTDEDLQKLAATMASDPAKANPLLKAAVDNEMARRAGQGAKPAPAAPPAPPEKPRGNGPISLRNADPGRPLEERGQAQFRTASWTSSARGSFRPAAFRTTDAFPELAPGAVVRLVATQRPVEPTAGEVSFSIVANGNSSGEAFELQVFDPTGKVKRIAMPEGVVLQALGTGSAKPAEVRTVGNKLTKQLTAYCLEFAKLPPEPGQLYRVAPQALQEKFKPLRDVLRAGRELAGAGQLHPDSDPKEYADAVRQYSLWAKLENWGEQKFTEMFVERTKKNAQAVKVKWTKQMENALLGMAPGRWRDISMVLAEAEKLSRADAQRAQQPNQ